MKAHVLGYKGMLGRYVYKHLKSEGYDVIGYTRKDIDAGSTLSVSIIRAMMHHTGVKRGDVVINCIGTIKPQVDKHGSLNAIKVNSLFPFLLAEACGKEGCKLIHITTDCVFSGKGSGYTEHDPHDCLDVYGKTKSLGEPINCTVVRTSIIGEEVGTKRSLIEWVKSEDGNTVNGYTNHFWNGLTCHQVAKVFEQIIREDLYWNGVKHIFTPGEPLDKNELVTIIAEVHGIDLAVIPVDGPTACDRSLSSVYHDPVTFEKYSEIFKIPHLHTQIEEQFNNHPLF